MSFAPASAPQRKRENAPPQRQPSQAQAPPRDDGNVGAEQIENPGAAPVLAMARVVSHSALQVAAPGAAADDANDDVERKQGEEDVELEMASQVEDEKKYFENQNQSISTKDLACVIKACRGQFCDNKYGHPNTGNPREKGKYYCQYTKKGCNCKDKNGACFNSHSYWWKSNESPQCYVCQWYVYGTCGRAANRCRMFHPQQIEGSYGNQRKWTWRDWRRRQGRLSAQRRFPDDFPVLPQRRKCKKWQRKLPSYIEGNVFH